MAYSEWPWFYEANYFPSPMTIIVYTFNLFKWKETLLLFTFMTISCTALNKLGCMVTLLTRDFIIWPLPAVPASFSITLSYPHWAVAVLNSLQCPWVMISLMSKLLQKTQLKWQFPVTFFSTLRTKQNYSIKHGS